MSWTKVGVQENLAFSNGREEAPSGRAGRLQPVSAVENPIVDPSRPRVCVTVGDRPGLHQRPCNLLHDHYRKRQNLASDVPHRPVQHQELKCVCGWPASVH